jgi:hypothetical protein
MSSRASRIAVSLLVACHLVAAFVPCGRWQAHPPAAHEHTQDAHEHALAHGDAPCHGVEAEPSTWLEARCPCGCSDQGPPSGGQGRLGAALRVAESAWPPAPTAAALLSSAASLPDPPLHRIDHVPLAT